MSLGFATRRTMTVLLIATLVPAPGLSWPRPAVLIPGAGDAFAQSVFLYALNSTDQVAMTGPGRPQLYLVFTVNLPVPPAGPSILNADAMPWLNEFLSELAKQPVGNAGPATVAAPADSILDEIAADDAHVRSLPSAQRLASMPETLNLEDNSQESVVERRMSVAIEDALNEAGFHASNSGQTTFKRGTGIVTYEGQNDDGDIVVTGRLVDGRIVLTKEFKPQTSGGDVGEPVRIRGTGAPDMPTQNSGTQNTGTQNTGTQTVTVNTPEATPLVSSPTAYNKALMTDLETKVRVITPNETNTALMGQISIRDTYVAQMNSMATGFENLLKNPAQLDTVVLGLRRDAAAVDNAYQNMLGAERAVITLQGQNPRVDLKGTYEADMRRAAQLDTKDPAGAEKIRTDARNTAYGNFVQRQQEFFQALDQNPLLGLGERNLIMPDDFLFKTIRNTLASNAPNSDYVNLVRPYFERAATEARDESTRAGSIKTAEDFVEFGAPKYERTRESMDAEGQANGSDLPHQFGQAAVGAYEQIEGGKAVRTEITNFGLNLVAGTAWVIPFIGPFISGGAAAIQVVREGDDLVVALLDAEDARNLAGVTGYTRIITAEDRVAAERGEFVLSVAGLALEGLQGIKVVKGPLPSGAGNAATDTTATAARNTRPPGAAPAPGTAPSSTPRTNAPVREVGADPLAKTGAVGDKTQVFPDAPTPEPPSLPKTRASDAELDGANAETLAELDEAYAENLARARAAGVSETRIEQLTAKSGPGHPDSINALYREALQAEGKQLMPLGEFGEASMFETRNRLGTLTEADYDWLRKKLAEDPNYLDRLPNRGRMDGTDGFIPPVTTDQVGDLLNNPRVAQMVDEAKSAAAAGAAADGTGTVVVPRGSTTGAQPAVTGVPDNTGTVILPAGSQPAIAGVADNAGTVILPPGSTPTVQLGPGATAPTVQLGPGATAPTVQLGPGATAPTVQLGPGATAPTVRLDPGATAPTVQLGPGATAPTVQLGPGATAPTVQLGPGATAPTVQLGPGTTSPTVQLGPGATAPTVQLGPGATAPTVRLGPEATAPTVRLGSEATAPTVRLDPNDATPTVRLDPNKTVTMDPNKTALIDPNATARMTNELMQSLPQARQSGMSPQQMANSVRGAMSKLGVGPQQLINSLRQRLLTPRPVSMAELGDPTQATPGQGVGVSLEALGVSSGVAFNVRAVNHYKQPVALQGEGVVVEPVSSGGTPLPTTPATLSTEVVTQSVEAFCLERVRPVAPAGTQYRVAPPAAQAQHRNLVGVLQAAQRVAAQLRPDSEIKGYFNFIRQWSIWTRQENFDEKRFTDEFVNLTKKNVEGQSVKWTDAMRDTVRKVAPGRWRDIMTVLGEVTKLKASAGDPSPALGVAARVRHQYLAPLYRRFEWV